METEKLKTVFAGKVQVKAVNYQNGNVYEAEGKITKADAGRGLGASEESLTIKGTDCGKSQMEVNYNSTSEGTGEQTADVELDIKGRVLDSTGKLIDVVAANAKLTKADAGLDGVKVEDFLSLKLENGCDAKCASTESYYTRREVQSGMPTGK